MTWSEVLFQFGYDLKRNDNGECELKHKDYDDFKGSFDDLKKMMQKRYPTVFLKI